MSGKYSIERDQHRMGQAWNDLPSGSWLGYGFWIAYGLVLLVTIAMGVAILDVAKSMQSSQVTPSLLAMPGLAMPQTLAHAMAPPAASPATAAMPGPMAGPQPGTLVTLNTR